MIRIYTVAEWGGKVMNNWDLPRKPSVGTVTHHMNAPNRKVFHGDPEHEADVAFHLARATQVDHMSTRRGTKVAWRDSGHHFMISRGGLILEGRNGSLAAAQKGMVIKGAHSGNNTANGNRWGIEWEGTYIEELPTPEQWKAGVELYAYLSIWGGTQAANNVGHRELKSTECPGTKFFHELDRFNEEVRTRKLELLKVLGK